MFLDTEVWIVLSGKNIPHFEKLGYKIPRQYDKHEKRFVVKQGTKILVNVKDLLPSCCTKVWCKCENPNCKNPIRQIQFNQYRDYCSKCSKESLCGEKSPHFGKSPSRKTKQKISNTLMGRFKGEKSPKWNFNFIEMAKKVHQNPDGTPKYNYSLVIYNGSSVKVIIICPIHGPFKQTPNSHLNGCGCPKCKIDILSGENSHWWNPNKTTEERLIRREYQEYYEWRKRVYKRDNYTCQCCGDDKGGNLEAHHLNCYGNFKEERIIDENGITLCKACHKGFHNIYGNRYTTKEMFKEFLKIKFAF